MIITWDFLLWQSFQDTTHNFSTWMQHLFHIFLFLQFWMFFVVKHFPSSFTSIYWSFIFFCAQECEKPSYFHLFLKLFVGIFPSLFISFLFHSCASNSIEQQNIHKTSNNCTKSIKAMSKTLKTFTKTSDQLRQQ